MRKTSLLGDIVNTFVSIAKGLKVTFVNAFRKKVTVMYPEEKIETAPNYRGVVSLPVDPETGKDICIGCGACARICPEAIIEIETELGEDKKRKVTGFKIDISRCMFCGLCTEVCPKQNLMMSNFYEAATTSREGMILDRSLLNKIGGMMPKDNDGEEEKKDAVEEKKEEASE